MELVTGATGLLGSHIAEQLIRKGEEVRALVRKGSDTRLLTQLGVELFEGDLGDRHALRSAMAGVRTVYHSAARVGDWGPWKEFERDVIGATRNVLEACSGAGVQRLVYISSTSAYGHPKPRPQPITEDEPLGSRFWLWDHYTRAKVEGERLVWEHQRRTGLPVTVIRPSWIYGPRDRTSIFRLARNLIKGKLLIIGRGRNRLNSVYAGNVAEACLLAADTPRAAGRAYNITNDGEITQQEYMGLFADALGVTRPWIKVPYRLAYGAAFFLEAVYRLLRTSNPPWATRYTVWLLGRCTIYCTERAQNELGWQPGVDYREGIRRTVEWYMGMKSPGKRTPTPVEEPAARE